MTIGAAPKHGMGQRTHVPTTDLLVTLLKSSESVRALTMDNFFFRRCSLLYHEHLILFGSTEMLSLHYWPITKSIILSIHLNLSISSIAFLV
jgi:hypothetical protein